MNRIAIAKETIQITVTGEYQYNSETVFLPEADFDSVVVITPELAQELLDDPLPDPEQNAPCKIEVTTEDTFSAAQRLGEALVLNFANAHHPGGGFLLGATAQEEALCRCSTLYASINSTAAAEMYRYNNLHIRATDSDYMLLSRDVSGFRDPNCELLPEPFSAAVITAPAPNRRGAAVLTGKKTLEQTFLHGEDTMVLDDAAHTVVAFRREHIREAFHQLLHISPTLLGSLRGEFAVAVFGIFAQQSDPAEHILSQLREFAEAVSLGKDGVGLRIIL